MGRFLGVSVGLIAVLTVIWFCSGNGIPAVWPRSEDPLPQFASEPEATQAFATGGEQVQHTSLIAKQLVSFTGQYAADDLSPELEGVAALELWNTGDSAIEYAEIVVYQQDRQLRFVATYIPAGCGILVPEKNKSPYTQAAVTDIQCLTVTPLESMGATVSVTESGPYSLVVSNLTQQTVDCVRVFYKRYHAGGDVLLGGVTYCVVLPNLGPGESREITPYQYASGDTKVVAVITEP